MQTVQKLWLVVALASLALTGCPDTGGSSGGGGEGGDAGQGGEAASGGGEVDGGTGGVAGVGGEAGGAGGEAGGMGGAGGEAGGIGGAGGEAGGIGGAGGDAGGMGGAGGDPCEPSDEVCDDKDNDCDGNTDEGFDGLGDECSAGTGACLATGTVVCSEDGLNTVCDAVAGEAGEEVCDGVDNDCDESTDEETGGSACETGQPGVCNAGTEVCAEGELTCAQDAEAGEELCDGLDNNCDGEVDNVEGVGSPCSAGVGACAAEGVTACGEDGELVCDAVPGEPGDEVCDGLDNNCDGEVDNVEGVGEACAAGVGACAAEGVVVCTPDGPACDAVPGQPGDEICDGADNNCDGEVDNVATVGDACDAGIGACAAAGVIVCSPEGPVCDAQPGAPQPEVCDEVDNDCNGAVDDVEGLGDECTAGVGACEARGQIVCTRNGPTCDAIPGLPSPEVCGDGVDNDCNGEADELPECGPAEDCAEPGDEDNNGVADCDDPACVDFPDCQPPPVEDCAVEGDEDGNGLADCADPACAGLPACQPVPEDCATPGDEDGNGLADCDDPACADFPACQPGDEQCEVPGDEDGNGLADCDDPACAEFNGCIEALNCDDGVDNDGNALVDCEDPACTFDFAGCDEAQNCDDGADNDLNGLVDCADPACAAAPGCEQPGGACGNLRVGITGGNFYHDELRVALDAEANITAERVDDCSAENLANYDVMIIHGNRAGNCGDEGVLNAWAEGGGTLIGVPWVVGNNNSLDSLPVQGPERRRNNAGYPVDLVNANSPLVAGVDFNPGDGNCPGGATPISPDPDCVNVEGATLRDGASLVATAPGDPENVMIAWWDYGAGRGIFLGWHYVTSDVFSAAAHPSGIRLMTNAVNFARGCFQIPEGVQQDVPEADVIAAGWQQCYSSPYGSNRGADNELATIQANCAGSHLMMACRPVGQANFTLAAAGEYAEVFRDVGDNADASHLHNGVEWYYSPNTSWGFAPGGEPVQRNSCDVNNPTVPELRMCIHTGGGFVQSGFRCGDNRLNGNNDWERVVFTRGNVQPPVEDCAVPGDEDGNGQADCADPACAEVEACVEALNCADGADNDLDGDADCADPDCADDPVCQVDPPARPLLMQCGTIGRDINTLVPPASGLQVDAVPNAACAPGGEHQAVLITRSGADQIDGAQLRGYLEAGGIAITEFNISDEIYNGVFPDAGVVQGARNGDCSDRVNPPVRFNENDPFWQANGALPVADGNNTGCGHDVSAFPGITRLGGWNANTVSLAYIDVGAGRLWLVDLDWQDAGNGFGEPSRQLMHYMILNGGAGGLPVECVQYSVFEEAERNAGNAQDGNVCDQDGRNENFAPGWYRFQGAAGVRMPTAPPPINTCATDAPGWLNGDYPAVEDGAVDRQACFNWAGNQCNWSADIQVRNCGEFYVFNLVDTPACQLAYCGEDLQEVALPANQAYGHHGGCNSFNDCGDAQTCADAACQFNGFAGAASFEEGLCNTLRDEGVVPDIVCNLFNVHELPNQNLDEGWGPSGGCNIPVAYSVTCQP